MNNVVERYVAPVVVALVLGAITAYGVLQKVDYRVDRNEQDIKSLFEMTDNRYRRHEAELEHDKASRDRDALREEIRQVKKYNL